MPIKMTIKEAKQNLARIESDLFLKEISSFNYSCLSIPHVEVLEDWHKGLSKQKFSNYQGTGLHLFLYKMDHGVRLDLVANTFKRVMKSENSNFASKRFKYILDKMPEEFTKDLFKKKMLY